MIRRSIVRIITICSLVTVAFGAPVAGQRPGAVEIGGFGRFTEFDPSLSLDRALGGGARLGVFIAPSLAIEVTGSVNRSQTASTGMNLNYFPIRGRLLLNANVAKSAAFLLGAGGVRNQYREAVRADENGASFLAGLRLYASHRWSIRAEGTLDLVDSPNFPGANSGIRNWGVQVGLSVLVGAGRSRDSDGDGIRDRDDSCPATPSGEVVDRAGCARDDDDDGVTGANDACPNTAAGEIVDETGCVQDSDEDGVTDANDRCPSTPTDAMVDATGCRMDSDGDRVVNARDRCPNTPAGAEVDRNGCPLDSDGDGVSDYRDRCPNTASGATVNESGCPTDGDGDGVFDGLDRCPDTEAGARVDRVGCPELFEENEVAIVLEGVNFTTGSADLTPNARTILARVAESLAANPTVRVEIGGHTDNTGARTTNVNLSQRRAESVMTFLIENGVAASQMTAQGYGPDQPIADNSTAAGRLENRRVELRRIN